jgi:hypothetical protein
MEYIEFFLFCLIAFGIPLALVCLKNYGSKNNKNVKPLLESGIKQKIRITNRHQNIFYPIALMMTFTFIPLMVLLPVFIMRDDGVALEKLLFGVFALLASFIGYIIFRFSGGFDDLK